MSLPHDPKPFLPYEVRVKIRRQDKSMTWQTRARFLVEGDAHDYADQWKSVGQTLVVLIYKRDEPKSMKDNNDEWPQSEALQKALADIMFSCANEGYPGARNIANKLVTGEVCITTPQAMRIWDSGYGKTGFNHFMEVTRDIPDGVDVIGMRLKPTVWRSALLKAEAGIRDKAARDLLSSAQCEAEAAIGLMHLVDQRIIGTMQGL